MESNNISEVKQPVQNGWAVFELICTALILLAVVSSAALAYMGHSADFLPIIKAYDFMPVNSAELLNAVLGNKELSIGIIFLFCLVCVVNIILKFTYLISGPNKTNFLSWIVILLSSVLWGFFFYVTVRLAEEARHDHSWFTSDRPISFGSGQILLLVTTFVFFVGMALKPSTKPTSESREKPSLKRR